MSDLIERLRYYGYPAFEPMASTCEEAADRIEELESGLETIGELRIQAERVLNQRIEELEKSNKNRGAAVVLAQEYLAEKDKRIEELETAFKELRKALKEHDDG